MDRPFKSISFPFWLVLLFFVAVDLCFILIHSSGWVLFRLGWTGEIPRVLRISEDRSFPEGFNYLKWAIISVSLIVVAIRDRWATPFLWALVFLMILADDAFKIHETFGVLIAELAHLRAGYLVKAGDLGELVVFGLMGLSVIMLTSLTFTRAGAASRGFSLYYARIIIVLAAFGVGVDYLHQVIVYFSADHPAMNLLKHIFALLEDGGEMMVASVATAFTLAPPASFQHWPDQATG